MRIKESICASLVLVVTVASLLSADGQTSAPANEGVQLLDQAHSGTNEHDRSSPDATTSHMDRRSQYVIGPADVIHVNVWKNTDLSQSVTVDPNGFVSLPLLGDVHVAGMTTDQMAAVLSSRLASYMVNPLITVSVVDIRSRQVYITGEVGKSGAYPLIVPVTILQLIAQAGGLNAYAKRKDIYVLRTTNGRTEKLPFNYTKVTHGDGRDNILLQPGDTVIVP